MELTPYKNIKIEVTSDGQFHADGIREWYDTIAKVQRQIDNVLKAETKKNFPIEAISSSMRIGKITSMNTYTGECWFVKEDGERSKERILDYSGKTKFFAKNEGNISLVKRYKEIEIATRQLSNEQRTLEKGLTEPIVFPTEEEKES